MKEPQTAPAGEDGRRLPSLAPGEVFASRYRVEKLLGQGLYGQVYLVKHLKYGQNMVLKVFYPGVLSTDAARQALKSEFEKVKHIKDPGVARYYDLGEWPEAGTRYITHEYLNGSSLRSLMDELAKQGKKFSPQDAVQIVIKLLQTLTTVHAGGVSHRNIKPQNILIVTRGRAAEKVQWDVRLSDYALTWAPVDWLTDISSEKLPYIAPEQLGYGGQVGPRADVYSVGALLYEMLTGTPPDPSMTPPSARRPSLPKKFDDIIELCLAQSATDRYGSSQDLLHELQDLPATLPLEEETVARSRLAPVLVILGLALLGVVIGFIVTRKPEVPAEAQKPEYVWKQLRAKYKDAITETPEEVAQKQAAAPPGMKYIPAGSFIKGALPNEPNAAQTEVAAMLTSMPGYYIDQYEFPNKAGAKPATGVAWEDAEKACNKIGKRLCTEEEWQRACKGGEFLIYSYGDAYDATKCPPIGEKGVQPIGSSPDCRSSYDIYDMSGGVSEWVNAAPQNRPDRRLTKGGLVGAEVQGTRCSAVGEENLTFADPNLGFRCCK